MFKEVVKLNDPDRHEIGDLVFRNKKLPCVIVQKRDTGGAVTAFLEEIGLRCRDETTPSTNFFRYGEFYKPEELTHEELLVAYEKYVDNLVKSITDVPLKLLMFYFSNFAKEVYSNYQREEEEE